MVREVYTKLYEEDYIIDRVDIDVQQQQVIVYGDKFPTQVITFDEEDTWDCVKNNEGEPVIDFNIWWDEEWGVQFSQPEVNEEGRVQTGSDYSVPRIVNFVNEDKTPFYETAKMREKYPNVGVTTHWMAVRFKDGNRAIEVHEPLFSMQSKERVESIGLYQKNADGSHTQLQKIDRNMLLKFNKIFLGD